MHIVQQNPAQVCPVPGQAEARVLQSMSCERHDAIHDRSRMCPPLTPTDLATSIGPGIDWELVALTGSTQSDLVAAARITAPARPRLLAALEQTAGRGRRGRSWLAQAGEALTFSLAVPWAVPLAHTPAVTLSLALALARALHPVPVRLKWPNDILFHGRKLAGLLVEYAEDPRGAGSLVIGLGINLHLSQAMRARIEQPAAALDEAVSVPLPQEEPARWLALLAQALVDASQAYARHGFGADRDAFLQHCLWLDDWVGVGIDAQLALEGYLRDVDSFGRLILEGVDGRRHAVAAGELSLRRRTGAVVPEGSA